jgi:endonuclease/exonuclease/phosphatase (EEP) superfamily protein YafD
MLGQLGRWYWQFDLINVFAPYWSGAGLGSALLWLLARRWTPAALVTSLILLTLGLSAMGPELAARISPMRSGPATLRLVQYNAFDHNASPRAAAAWIAGTGADIVVVEEVSGTTRELLHVLTATYPFQVSCLPRMMCSTMILSRVRPSSLGSLAHDDSENRKAPSAAWMRFGDGPGAFTVVGVHYQRPAPFGDHDMARQAVLEMLRRDGRERTIVAGDFNMVPWTFAMKRQDAQFAMARVTRARFTWPANPLALLPIDHVYLGREWRMLSLTIGPANGSDHHPVFLTLSDAASD